MKKIFFAAIAAIGFWACSSQEEPQLPELNETPATVELSVIRTPEEAKSCAISAFSRFYGMSRAIMPIKDVLCVKSKTGSRSAINDTLYYIVNTENNDGYAIIAANREVGPVLAVTESGNIEDPDNIENPGLAMYLDYLNVIPKFQGRPINDSLTTIQPNPWWVGDGDHGENPLPGPQYRTETHEKIDEALPRATYNWGQHFPEGTYFRNGIAGCGNTATLLLMSYFEHPSWIKFEKAGGKKVDWALIKSHYQSFGKGTYYDYCGGVDTPAHREIADLCYTIGLLNDSDDSKSDKTSTTIKKVHGTLVSIRSNNFMPQKIMTGMPNGKNSLGNGIIYTRATDNKEGGHAFIIDGYKEITTTVINYKRESGESIWTETSRRVSVENYNHINWGWCGMDNGYFYVDEYQTNKGHGYDSYKNDSTYYNFTKNFQYFVVTKKINE